MAATTLGVAGLPPEKNYQYKRNFKLIISNRNGDSIDLSPLHCKFSVKRSTNQSPNTADVRVYNLKEETANAMQMSLAPVADGNGLLTTNRGFVTIQGGYNSNFGVIFQGNIKQIILGRESATDTFVDFVCGDGDLAYTYAVVNSAIGGNSTIYSQADILNQISAPMIGLGVNLDFGLNTPPLNPNPLPRGKTYFGDVKGHLRKFSDANGLTWSIQNGELQFIPEQGYVKGEAVVLTSKTGMIGTPQQTSVGVNTVCLMNPLINPGRPIFINNKSIAGLKIDLSNPKAPANAAPSLRNDGVYTVLVVETTGDNRGIDWYSKLICLSINASEANLINSVSVTYGL